MLTVSGIEDTILKRRRIFTQLQAVINQELYHVSQYFNFSYTRLRGLDIITRDINQLIRDKTNHLIYIVDTSDLELTQKEELTRLFPIDVEFTNDIGRVDGSKVLIKEKFLNKNITITFNFVFVKHFLELTTSGFQTRSFYYDPHVMLSDHQMKTSESAFISFGTWNTMNRLEARKIEHGRHKNILDGTEKDYDFIRYRQITDLIFNREIYLRGLPCIVCLQECMKGVFDQIVHRYSNPHLQLFFSEYDGIIEENCNMGGFLTIVFNPRLQFINKRNIFTEYTNSKGISKKKLIAVQTLFRHIVTGDLISVMNVHLPFKYAREDFPIILDKMLIDKEEKIMYEYIIGDFNLNYSYIVGSFDILRFFKNIDYHYIFPEKTEFDVDHGFLFARKQ